MFGRTVKIDGREIMVFCRPDTPLSEILRIAASMVEREEAAARVAYSLPYRDAVGRLSGG